MGRCEGSGGLVSDKAIDREAHPKNRVYITLYVDLQEDEDAGDVADEIVCLFQEQYDLDGGEGSTGIQAISDTPPVHRKKS